MRINWLKLSVNIIDDEKIDYIRTMPDGDSLFVLWIGLLTMAMKSTRCGIVEISSGIPYTKEALSSKLKLKASVIDMGIALFKKLEMIDTYSGGEIEILNFIKYQEIDKIEKNREQTKARVQKYRDLKRLCNADVTQPVTQKNGTYIEPEPEPEPDIVKNENPSFVTYKNTKPISNNKPKSIEEVYSYFKLKKYPARLAEPFFNHYEANGWVQGGGKNCKPIKNWHAAAGGWVARDKEFHPELWRDVSKTEETRTELDD